LGEPRGDKFGVGLAGFLLHHLIQSKTIIRAIFTGGKVRLLEVLNAWRFRVFFEGNINTGQIGILLYQIG
jgi:hypothetical protein